MSCWYSWLLLLSIIGMGGWTVRWTLGPLWCLPHSMPTKSALTQTVILSSDLKSLIESIYRWKVKGNTHGIFSPLRTGRRQNVAVLMCNLWRNDPVQIWGLTASGVYHGRHGAMITGRRSVKMSFSYESGEYLAKLQARTWLSRALVRLANTPINTESAWDDHVLPKYSPIKFFFTHRLSNKPFLIRLLTTPPHLKYVATF